MSEQNRKQLIENGELLPVMENFYTIQGEGYYSGKAAHFIRLAGCDVGCHWCDVKESWDEDAHPYVMVDEIIKTIDARTEIVVITGGEPLMWNLDIFTKKIQDLGMRTHIETSGAHPLSGSWDWICLSPKKMKMPLEEVYKQAHELKIIVCNKHDFLFAVEQGNKCSDTCNLYLQSEWSKKDKITPLMVDFIKDNVKWGVSMQTHKYLDIP